MGDYERLENSTPSAPAVGFSRNLGDLAVTGNKFIAPSLKTDKPASGPLREIAKYLTGITILGLPYLLIKTITVRSGQVAVTWDAGKLKIYGEGRHLLFSPFHTFSHFLNLGQRVFQLEQVRFISADQIPMNIVAVLTCQIIDPKKSLIAVDDVERALIEQAETTLSGIFRSHTFNEICPNVKTANQQLLGRQTVHVKDEKLDEKVDSDTEGDEAESQKLVGKLQAKFMREFQETIREWGVHLFSLKILKVGPENSSFASAAETGLSAAITAKANKERLKIENKTAVAKQQNQNRVKLLALQAEQKRLDIDCSAQARRIKMLAQADANAIKMNVVAQIQSAMAETGVLGTIGDVATESKLNEEIASLHMQEKYFSASKDTRIVAGFDINGMLGDELYLGEAKPQQVNRNL